MSEIIANAWLNFSQSSGIEDLPRRLAPRDFDKRARNILFSPVYSWFMSKGTINTNGYYYSADDHVDMVIETYFVFVMGLQPEQTDEYKRKSIHIFKAIFESQKWNEVLDLISFLTTHTDLPDKLRRFFIAEYKKAFLHARVAYFMTNDGRIQPIISEVEANTAISALDISHTPKFNLARNHLLDAGACIDQANYVDSVRESIHAVEAVGRVLLQKESAKVSDLIKWCIKEGYINDQLREALNKINSFADAHARHSAKTESEIDLHEAAFMYGCCASFVTLLINKSVSRE